jgi:periplasmic protein TonB
MTPPARHWFDADPRARRRWIISGVAVLCGYAAAAAAGLLLWRPQPHQIGDDSSVISIELAPIDSTADAKRTDVAPAPKEMVEQKAIPAQPVKQPEQPKVEEQPPPKPAPTAIALPMEKKPPVPVAEQRPPAPVTAAPVKGGAPRIAPSWESRLFRRLQQAKRYPSEARAHGEQGVVLLAFSIDRDGHVISRHVVHGSGYAALDDEAMALVMRAQPMPAFPPSMTEAELNLTVPIHFSLR